MKEYRSDGNTLPVAAGQRVASRCGMDSTMPDAVVMDAGRFASLAEPDRTRANTWPTVNAALDRAAQLRLDASARVGAVDVAERIAALNQEWDIDRVIEAEAAIMGLAALALGVVLDRRVLVAAAVVSSMVTLHGTHGWYPMLPLFRRLGVRTRQEIDRERYALKAIRGDFSGMAVSPEDAAERAAAAWKAVCA